MTDSPRDEVVVAHIHEPLEVVLQHPTLLSAEQWTALYAARFTVPQYAAVHQGVKSIQATYSTYTAVY